MFKKLLLALLLMLLGQACARRADADFDPEREVPSPPFEPSRAAHRPRTIVFILIDALRYDYLGTYGCTRGLTPNIDRLAAQSVVFENAITTSAWTRSSMASMFTSRFPTAIQVLSHFDGINEDAVTLAEVLRLLGGYRTIGVTTNPNVSQETGAAQGFDLFLWPADDDLRSYPGDLPIWPGEAVNKVARKSLETMRTQAQGAEQRPVFLYLHYIDCHDPYLPHPGTLPDPEPAGRFNGSRKQVEELDRIPLEQITAADRDRIKHIYAGALKHCDAAIGELLRTLARDGYLDDALIVLTADHGEGLWDHRVRAHGKDLYEEMVHVPLIIHAPGMTEQKALRVSRPISMIDLAPTILATCGIAPPPTFQGRDLSPLMRGLERDLAHDYIYCELQLQHVHLDCIRVGRYKLIRDRTKDLESNDAYELYDLARDPDERNDLIGSLPREEMHLKTALSRWQLAVLHSASPRKNVDLEKLGADELRSLRALGYISEREYSSALERTPSSDASLNQPAQPSGADDKR